jgi:hypothetical protein
MMIFFILFILVILEQTPETNDQDEFFKKRDVQVGEITHPDSSRISVKINK